MEPLADFDYRDLHDIASIRRALPPIALGAGVASERVDDLVLMACELMVNALTHGRTAEPRMWMVALDGEVHVAVTDTSARPPQVQPLDGTRVGGNGLRVVEALADAWGVEHHDGLGKSVWFSLRPA